MHPALAHLEVIRSIRRSVAWLDFEAILEQTYRRLIKPGQTVIDVGAHAGRHTKVFADLVGRDGTVIAIEPLPEMTEVLAAMEPPVSLHQCAISEEEGLLSFVRANGALECSGLKQRHYQPDWSVSPETITVVSRRLDNIGVRQAHFIKIDTEGGEIGVIRSGLDLIGRNRPWISAEYGRSAYEAYGHQRRTLFDLAHSIDYVIGDLFGAVIDDLATWEQVCDQGMWDWYLVPAERSEEWSRAIS